MGCEYLYFDIETVPDESRFPILVQSPSVELVPPFAAADAPGKSVDEIKRAIGGRLFPSAWVEAAIGVEAQAKNRATAIAELRRADPSAAEQLVAAEAMDRIKLGSTTPEFCRIISMAIATDNGPVFCLDGEDGGEPNIIDEFFTFAADAKRLVGFNCIAFDIPVIFVRAAMLGLTPRKLNLDLRPVGSRNVIDLYTARFGPRGNSAKDRPGGLKALCDVYGLTGSLMDREELTSGGDVYQFIRSGNIDAVRKYNRIDVELTRRLHNFYAGFFC